MSRFADFIRERKYLSNVSPATVSWYTHAFKWLPSESPTQAELKDVVLQFYGRIVVILRPDLNGLCEFRVSRVDSILGLELEPFTKGKSKRYGRRLRWGDGTSLEHGWRPTLPIRASVARRRPDVH